MPHLHRVLCLLALGLACLRALAQAPSFPCTFADKRLPDDTVVVGAGAYKGRELNFQIDQSGHKATQFDVLVHADRPVALLLGAYEPSIWNISWTRGTRVVAVFASGYHRAVVAGLPPGTPVITSSYEEKSPCGYNYFGPDAGLGWLNPKSRSLFGKPATRLFIEVTEGGRIDVDDSMRPKSPYQTSAETPPESFRDAGAPLAGTAGLEEAVRKGNLRPATEADLENVRRHFLALAQASAPAGTPPKPIQPHLPRSRTFVVLKPMAFPAGLYGANLAAFIIPVGVPRPSGHSGHSTLVDLGSKVQCDRPGC